MPPVGGSFPPVHGRQLRSIRRDLMEIVPERSPSESCSYATATGGPEGVSFMVVSGRIARITSPAAQSRR